MAIVIITTRGNADEWRHQLNQLNPEIDIRIYPNDDKREEVDFALAWNPPVGAFKHYPNLKCIASTGAGADHIIKDPELPEHLKITRVVDQRLTKDMTTYLITYVLAHLRNTAVYHDQAKERNWQRLSYKVPEKTTIGIMGMGELGKYAASKFLDMGFKVKGWAKTSRPNDGVKMFTGLNELPLFLADIDILICLLPLTPETKGIISKSLIKKLPRGAYIVNVARGEHLNEKDLIEAINDGHLSGACLDVFKNEPLPIDHPFWDNDKITITPHTASITSLVNVAPQILENYRRMESGQPLINEVVRDRGY